MTLIRDDPGKSTLSPFSTGPQFTVPTRRCHSNSGQKRRPADDKGLRLLGFGSSGGTEHRPTRQLSLPASIGTKRRPGLPSMSAPRCQGPLTGPWRRATLLGTSPGRTLSAGSVNERSPDPNSGPWDGYWVPFSRDSCPLWPCCANGTARQKGPPFPAVPLTTGAGSPPGCLGSGVQAAVGRVVDSSAGCTAAAFWALG